MAQPKQLDVFVCSTCYDLLDLRTELGRYLVEQGFSIRMSDDPDSDFSVEPAVDSIESCLANVAAADAVVCIIDRRYGGLLKSGPYQGKSATQAEVEYARSLPKPVFFFVRDRAANDYAVMRDNGVAAKTRWVQERNEEQRKRWFEFVRYVSELPRHADWSNWYDPFKDVVDLKRIVVKRLVDYFPEKAISRAMEPDRLVRVTFVPAGGGAEHRTVYGHFQNVGVGPAMNLVYGREVRSLFPPIEKSHRGGLAEGDDIRSHDGQNLAYTAPVSGDIVVFCEYENRFGDKYRVEQEFATEFAGGPLAPEGSERLFVAVPGTEAKPQWRQVR
jgi:nucleoside 2-deoxyribosyltransferase